MGSNPIVTAMQTEFEGKIYYTSPSTIHMDSTTPIGVRIRYPDSESLRHLMGKTVKIIVIDEDE